ncbi:tRNA (N6-threonylcarbamoyladenosine(37)-N6)-methyltransferase TrmO [Methanoculleus sp. FWC-SCC3]|uniref:tRNA (N6-threonylcarbamoyladenosine(37)-N6)-methyltransferase TrmO n=1 Tax=Methanoculleus methanifontis TaxID=2584086 RepID=A0ABT8M240_9EURY|nr:tRNA (N6-threonylcarbamoyladenosine(37)-N6)-methyltransferase TrmO [Methanoculleus sp. FWC-SCC3]MDN7013104.1 tRNA (N6-threonylcarbamoyladenosine(37)-N6)-methyltransferase TrmO [Methanoculleus sp. FWC-SCC3]
MELFPIGLVHSSVRSRSDMPVQGVDAEIEIFPRYAGGLSSIEENSHLILVCWMHEAGRDILTAVARKVSADLPEKGVFSLRSPVRPNPLSVSVVRLRGVRDGRFLALANVDLIDETSVIDIKPYQAGWDCVFSATGHDRTQKIQKMSPGEYRAGLVREAVNYHGELCTGVAVAVRVAEAATRIFERDLRHPQISVAPGPDPCIADALIGITGASPGNRRLKCSGGDRYVLSSPGEEAVFSLRNVPESVDAILVAGEASLFGCTVSSRPQQRR